MSALHVEMALALARVLRLGASYEQRLAKAVQAQLFGGGDQAVPVRAHLRRTSTKVVAVPAYVRTEQRREAEIMGPARAPVAKLLGKVQDYTAKAATAAEEEQRAFDGSNQNTARRQRMAAPHLERAMIMRDRAARWTRWAERVQEGHVPTRFEEMILASSKAYDAASYNHRRLLGEEHRTDSWTGAKGVRLDHYGQFDAMITREFLDRKRKELDTVREVLAALQKNKLPLGDGQPVKRETDYGMEPATVAQLLKRVAGLVYFTEDEQRKGYLPFRPNVIRSLEGAQEQITGWLRSPPAVIARAEEISARLGDHLRRVEHPGQADEIFVLPSEESLEIVKDPQLQALFPKLREDSWASLSAELRDQVNWGEATYEGRLRNANLFQQFLDLTRRERPEAARVLSVDRTANSAPLHVRMEAAQKAEARRWIPANLQGLPEFFETPPTVAVEMTDFLELEPGQRVLEPSAGRGGLADFVPAGVEIVVAERSPSLREELAKKGYQHVYGDQADVPRDQLFDAVLMNPPFSEEVEHFNAAMSRLKPGGRFAVIMSNALTFRRDHAQLLGELQDDYGAEIRALPANTFQRSGTGAQAVLILGRKPSA